MSSKNLCVSCSWDDTHLDWIVVPDGADVIHSAPSSDVAEGVRNPIQLAAEGPSFMTLSGDQVRALLDGERVLVREGSLSMSAELVPAIHEPRVSVPRDWTFARVLVSSLLIHVFFIFATYLAPPPGDELRDDALRAEGRITALILRPAVLDAPPTKLDLSFTHGSRSLGGPGKVSKTRSPPEDAMASRTRAPRVDPRKRESDRDVVMRSGILGVLGAARTSAVDGIFASGDIGTGLNDALGGLAGLTTSEAGGAGGLASRGTRAGGGGPALGIGGLGDGPGSRGPSGRGGLDLSGPGKRGTQLLPGPTTVVGALNRDEIGRVIRAHTSRFKFCYQSQLNANVELSGKVSVRFTIAPTGAVHEAKVHESSMDHAAVESCVLRVMQSLQFPAPRGGGVVIVTYPFVFQST